MPCKDCGTEISTEADSCPKCGAKLKKPSGCGVILLILFLAVIGFFVLAEISGTSSQKLSMAQRYPGPWINDVTPEIAQALVKNNITDCGALKYRSSSVDSGEYLVYCSPDGSSWRAYIVWIPINKVEGPFIPDPSLGN